MERVEHTSVLAREDHGLARVCESPRVSAICSHDDVRETVPVYIACSGDRIAQPVVGNQTVEGVKGRGGLGRQAVHACEHAQKNERQEGSFHGAFPLQCLPVMNFSRGKIRWAYAGYSLLIW